MSEIVASESNLTVQRTPNLIAAEINNIKNETKKMVLYNSIEIGRRLIEAKALIPHGEWGEWLEKSVDYSQRTANNLMRIFEEYGADQITLLGDNAKSQAIANLSYTQAVALLGVAPDEREKFIEENDVENMSTRELQRIIKEKEKALKEKEELELKLKKTTDNYEKLEESNKKYNEKAESLIKELELTKKKLLEAEKAGDNEEINRIQESLKNTQEELENSKTKIEELEKQLEERPIEVNAETIIEKVPDEIEKELQELREKANENIKDNTPKIKFSIYFDELVKNFNDLLGALEEIKTTTEEENYEKHKNAVIKLMDKMKENL